MSRTKFAEWRRQSWQRLGVLRRTLRFRLMLWNAVVVGVTLLVMLFGLRFGVRYALLREIDEILREDLQEIALAIREGHRPDSDVLHDELDRKARGHTAHHWFVTILDSDRREIWASHNAPEPRPELPRSTDFTPASIGLFRVMQYRERSLSPPRFIRVGASLSLINQDLSRLDRAILGMTAFVFVAAPLVGYWLAGRTTGYLSEVIHTASRLHPDLLQERLPVRGTGDELDQLAKTINLLLDRIASHLQERRDFIANAAHELRTPLAAIRSSVEVALNGDRSAIEYAELLSEIMEEGTSLETLVNQLLLLSETESDALKHRGERFCFDEIVLKSVDMFRGVAETKDVKVVLEDIAHVELEGNRQHVRQVLNNLIDNAIKFTPAGGTVTVRLSRDDTLGHMVLEVRDTGIGMRPEDVPRVFERFYRADNARSRDAEHKGTGLGLSICRAVVEAHGGTITVQSQLRRGSTFVVTLPLATTPHGSEVAVFPS